MRRDFHVSGVAGQIFVDSRFDFARNDADTGLA
jgi:hypothetical protein